MKNTFYLILKALFILKILKFGLTFWSCRKIDSMKKMRLISNFMSQPVNK